MNATNSSPRQERVYALLAGIISVSFWVATQVYWAPVTRGGDRNGYLLGGRMLAEGHIRGITPADPYIYLGPHWITAAPGIYQLKYPLGLPAIYAVIHWIFGDSNWSVVAHQISPAAAALGVWGSFILMRPVVGALHAMLGTLLLATSPLTFFFANLPNSHATAFCVAVWGMTLLLKWWREGKAWMGVSAAVLLGFNFTVRYTEGLLVLPLLLVIGYTVWRDRRAWRQGLLMLIAWVVPVASLIVFNLLVLKHASGYSLTHESTAFSFGNIAAHGREMIGQLYQNGIWFLLPVSVIGGAWMFRRDWRMAAVLCVWAAPTILVYTAYYWTPTDEPGLSYARFTLTVLPALVVMAMWLFQQLPTALNAAAIALVFVVAIADGRSAAARAGALQQDNLACGAMLEQINAHIPVGAAIYTQQAYIPMLEVAGDWRLYLDTQFTARYVRSYGATGSISAGILQPERAAALNRLLGNQNDRELAADQSFLISDAIAHGRRVFAVLPVEPGERFRRRYVDGRGLRSQSISSWDMISPGANPTSPSGSTIMQLVEIVAD